MEQEDGRGGGQVGPIKCPGCDQLVVPAGASPDAVRGPAEGWRGRWSAFWRAPAGQLCPQCGFPLTRYAARFVWIRLLFAGIVLLMVQPFFFLLALMGALHGWFAWVVALTGGAGLLGVMVGLGGIAAGGPIKRSRKT